MPVNFDDVPQISEEELNGSFPPPSRFVRVVMKPMTKLMNPLIRKLAGRRHFNKAAKIYHRGRRSGRQYVTPATARPSGDHFWVGLTFGPNSDWCKNVRAAGECTIRWHGIDYHAVRPVVVDRSVALSDSGEAFTRGEKSMMRAIGVKQFLRLDVDEAA